MRAAVSLVQVASPPDESLAARRERAAALIRERATGADLGRSRIVDPWGEVVLEADDTEGVFTAIIDTDLVGRVREEFPVLGDRVPGGFAIEDWQGPQAAAEGS